MPKSKIRKKAIRAVSSDRRTPLKVKAAGPSHPVYLVVMLGLMLLGLAWMVVYYIAQEKIPLINMLGPWNFAVGFALMIAGLLMTTRWR